jgi:methyl-accepting chemotaxis protein
VKKLAHDTRSATSQIASTIGELTREAGAVTSEIKTGVERSRAAQQGFSQISDTVKEVSEIVGMVDRQTEGIAHSTSMIQTSVDRVKAGLTAFAGDARDNGGQLIKAQKRLTHLEMLSNTMLDTLANSGAEIDDTPFISLAQEAMRRNPAGRRVRPCQWRNRRGRRLRPRLCPDRGLEPASVQQRVSPTSPTFTSGPVLDRLQGARRAHHRLGRSPTWTAILPTHLSERLQYARPGPGVERRALPQPPHLHGRDDTQRLQQR